MSSEIMTREQQRIAVAVCSGAKWHVRRGFLKTHYLSIEPEDRARQDGWYNSEGPAQGDKAYIENSVPDYDTDANAQLEAWRTLNAGNRKKFHRIQAEVAAREGIAMLDAFNRHFCEIFLRVKGLWNEK